MRNAVCVAVALAAGATLALPPGLGFAGHEAFAEGSPRAGSGGAWVEFSQPYPLADSRVRTLQGDWVSNGACDVNFGTLTLAPGERAVEEREIALNESTCQEQIETGTPPVNATSSAVTPASVGWTQSQATFKTWWTDPIGKEVNHVYNTATWQYAGTSYCIAYPSTSKNYNGLGASGWFIASSRFYPSSTCQYVESASDVQWSNNTFCLFQTTNVWYNYNHVRGWNDGHISGNVDSYASGGCYGALSKHEQLVRNY